MSAICNTVYLLLEFSFPLMLLRYKLSKKSSLAIEEGLVDNTLSTNLSALIFSYWGEVQTEIKYEQKKF